MTFKLFYSIKFLWINCFLRGWKKADYKKRIHQSYYRIENLDAFLEGILAVDEFLLVISPSIIK